uniref:Ubiquitin carboxyl-terminal hydrolase n=1 Tax=Haptolina brevifila TaxID=156173 RepID=A0A7S2CLZ0_9EUKA|mmetsp:Transcript_26583/g.53420  ORF Transcript_26583/g.53420 Transcript_26583/m.53420 type:complete len:238 (+) Transcript_26583:105-818(+)
MQNLSIRDDWVGLESNPDVLTEYAHKLGVDESWGFVDVFGLDEESLKHVPDPCVGMILLFPFSQREAHRRSHGTSRGRPTEGVWFMRQTVGNACGAVALMHTVMNCMDRVSKGSGKLEGFRKDAKNADPRQRGKLFSVAMRDVHVGMASQGQTVAPKASDNLDFHFVSIVAVDDVLYELDGNNDGPIRVGTVGKGREGSFLRCVVDYIQKEYINPFPDSHFSMISLGPRDPKGDDSQ